ncbi:hypothetical protein J2Y67_005415 [Neobacillus niacini]|nr:hypothetical protein [Neobacillus niacini]
MAVSDAYFIVFELSIFNLIIILELLILFFSKVFINLP